MLTALILQKSHGVPQEPTKFDLLCDTVSTAMVTLNGALQEVLLSTEQELICYSLDFFILSICTHTHTLVHIFLM